MGYVVMVFLRAAIKSSGTAFDRGRAIRETIIPAYYCRGYSVTRLHYFFDRGDACVVAEVQCEEPCLL
jgi:hypothetical protein